MTGHEHIEYRVKVRVPGEPVQYLQVVQEDESGSACGFEPVPYERATVFQSLDTAWDAVDGLAGTWEDATLSVVEEGFWQA